MPAILCATSKWSPRARMSDVDENRPPGARVPTRLCTRRSVRLCVVRPWGRYATHKNPRLRPFHVEFSPQRLPRCPPATGFSGLTPVRYVAFE
jgi:hypothetical protein